MFLFLGRYDAFCLDAFEGAPTEETIPLETISSAKTMDMTETYGHL